ncbi:MAG: hypothetical protein KIS92_06285 [Planctomycetota bacterium]|nr:hypothetical protein [Planctomycetota bacterium]
MEISAVDAVTPAIDRAKHVCFNPLDLGKWFLLGFCAFLAYLGQGGGGFPNFSGNIGGGPGGASSEIQQALDWIKANLGLVVLLAVAFMAVSFVIGQLVLWLQSRGTFMFIDGIVHNRGLVVQPWHEFAELGNSLYMFRFAISCVSYLVMLVVVGLPALIAWGDLMTLRFTSASLIGIILFLVLWIPAILVFFIVHWLVMEFVAPTMYLRRIRALEAWQVVRSEIVAGRTGTLFVYFLLKVLLGMVVGFLATVATCLTCCVAGLPYIGSVILLPLFVFDRSYSLHFLEQFGPQWKFFQDEAPPPPPIESGPYEPPQIAPPPLPR